ncbi:hypothetical protein Goari_002825, partial [Gossypium aridum]|nr:hypothetical protein [Gossypium aridum]
DKVLRKGNVDGEKVSSLVVVEDNEDLEFLEGDVIKSTINGISLINFSDHIQYILVKDMELTVMVKFYHTAQLDFDEVLSWGPWIVYGQYLTVKPWTIDFNPLQPYPSVVLVWGEKEPTAVSSIPNTDKSNEGIFSPWMQVQRKSRHNLRDNQNQNTNIVWKVKPGSRLLALMGLNENEGEGGEITMVGSNGVKGSLGFVLGDNQGNMKGVKGESSRPITREDASVSDFEPGVNAPNGALLD